MGLENLKAFFRLNNVSYVELADLLGLNKATISQKINLKEGREFSRAEIKKMKQNYDLRGDFADILFYDEKYREDIFLQKNLPIARNI